MSLPVRNCEPNRTILRVDDESKEFYEWAESGSPDGEDIQQLPDRMLENPRFLRAVNRGILEVLQPSPKVEAALQAQMQMWQRRVSTDDAQAAVVPVQQSDTVVQPCVGPSRRGTGSCGEAVLVRAKARFEHPPLCSIHKDLAPQFVPQDGEKVIDGQVERHWVRATLQR